MGNTKKSTDQSRRGFFSHFLSKKETSTEKIKMLTAEGKLVEVDKAVFDAATKKQKATNKDIYTWMNNPSKETNE
ncbi:MAG: hypothetical protein ABL876_04100 [Chitinophagaceae bacterium]